MSQRLLPSLVVGDVVEHIEGVHDVELLEQRRLAHVREQEPGLGVADAQAFHRSGRDIEPGDVGTPSQIVGGEESGAAAHVEHFAAARIERAIAKRAREHAGAQRIAGLIVGQRQPGFAGPAQIELFAQAAIPEFARLIVHLGLP